MGRVDGDGVDAPADERLDPRLEVVANADGSGAAQPAGVVAAGVGELLALLDVLHRDQPGEPAVAVDERQLLDAVPLEDRLGLVERRPDGRRDQAGRRHEVGDRAVVVGRLAEADVAVGEDADEAAVAVGDRHAGELEAVHHLLGLVQGGVGVERDRIGDHPALAALDLLHLGRLVLDRQVAMDDTDAAVAGHGDRHPGLGDLVHRRRHEGHRQGDPGGERGRRVDGVGQRLGVAGDDDDVVERQRLEAVEQAVVGVGGGSVMRVIMTRAPFGCAELGEDLDEQAVLGGVDTLGQRVEGVVGIDRDGCRAEDGSVVDALVGDEVDHHPGGAALASA